MYKNQYYENGNYLDNSTKEEPVKLNKEDTSNCTAGQEQTIVQPEAIYTSGENECSVDETGNLVVTTADILVNQEHCSTKLTKNPGSCPENTVNPEDCTEKKTCTPGDCTDNKPCNPEDCTENKPCNPGDCTENKPCNPGDCTEIPPYKPKDCTENNPCNPGDCTEKRPYNPEECTKNKTCSPGDCTENKPYNPEGCTESNPCYPEDCTDNKHRNPVDCTQSKPEDCTPSVDLIARTCAKKKSKGASFDTFRPFVSLHTRHFYPIFLHTNLVLSNPSPK